jgi:hypothetical protein
MPLWVYIVVLVIALSVGGYRKWSEGAALRQRQAELEAQRATRLRTTRQAGE